MATGAKLAPSALAIGLGIPVAGLVDLFSEAIFVGKGDDVFPGRMLRVGDGVGPGSSTSGSWTNNPVSESNITSQCSLV